MIPWKNFSMVLEFYKLEYHEKFDFAKLEYPKSNRSLYIFETMIYCNIICKNVLFGYFRPQKKERKKYIDHEIKCGWMKRKFYCMTL